MAAARILVVEGETIVAMGIASTLRRLGYDVVGMAGTGGAAIETAQQTKPDLILMDIRLNGRMDGIEAATAIQQERVTPIIFLTTHADLETVERAKSAAPYGYLVKPFDEGAVHRMVEIALQRVAANTAERGEALDALWQSEERFRLLVDAVKDYAIFMIDREGRIASWNAGAERMTGFTSDDVLGKPVLILRPRDSKAEALQLVLERLRHTGSAEWDGIGVKKDGTRYTSRAYGAAILNRVGEELGFVFITRDVTEQRNLEAQLIQAQKLESLGQLAGGIAHDFNNMLMVIFSRCELLLRQLGSATHRQFVSDILAAAGKNRDLTQQLLGAARRQVMEPSVVSLNDVITSALQLLAPTLGEHLAIHTELEGSLWNVYADPTKLHQVMLNLAINARDAMTSGGTLTIESRNVRVDTTFARQHVGLREGDYVSLVVSDTGSGIPRTVRDRIYDPFFTTKEPGHGTGLGLAVVRGIVEQTGGRIWMYSEEGRGTSFKLFLPRHDGEAYREIVTEEVMPERGWETILLVEDEELLRAVVRETLEEQGYQVLEARSPAEAVSVMRGFAATIHLLLTDVIMPGMTGLELAEACVSTRPELRVIFMSGYSSHAMMNVATLPVPVRYLEKPITTSVLLRSLRGALEDA
ncbi:MAG: Blue-light-activated protein [Acidobacteria bacterium]|nr:Blue-light-activated protein [Acidobacteriota bacterium]